MESTPNLSLWVSCSGGACGRHRRVVRALQPIWSCNHQRFLSSFQMKDGSPVLHDEHLLATWRSRSSPSENTSNLIECDLGNWVSRSVPAPGSSSHRIPSQGPDLPRMTTVGLHVDASSLSSHANTSFCFLTSISRIVSPPV